MSIIQRIVAWITAVILSVTGASGVTLRQKAENFRVTAYVVVRSAGEAAARAHVGIYEDMLETFVFLPGETAFADRMWGYAKNLAENDAQLEHILRSELSWRFWKASAGVGEFANPFKAVDARRQLMADFEKFGVTMMNEGTQHELNPLYMYVPTRYWYDSMENMSAWEKFTFVITRNVDLLHRYRLFFQELAGGRVKSC